MMVALRMFVACGLVAAGISALTIFDMAKALDKGIEIREIVLERKSGGKSGEYRRKK